MKKIYASMLAFGVVFGASAQVALQQVQQIKMQANHNTVALGQPTATPSVAATGDTINGLYYDFSDASEWTFGNVGTATGSWVIGTTVPAGDFPLDGILSTTASNGFALYDSDLFCSASDNAFVQLANPVDLSGQGSVAIQFQQFYRTFYDQTFVEVSTDGTNWTSYEVNGSLAVNATTANPVEVQVNISGSAANQSQVWVRFRFMGACDYSWMIDDVAFVEGATNDINLTDVWHGDILGAFEYQQIPLAQAQEVVIGAACTNTGGDAQTNAVYTYDISDGSTSVASGTFAAINTTLASAASDTTWYSTGFTPSATGTYTVTVSVAGDVMDEVPGNDSGESIFKITNNIYAHDDEDNIEFQINGGDATGTTTANEYKAALYYEVVADATLTAVQVAFGANTTTASCIIEVFDADNDQTFSNPIATEVYDLVAGDVSSGSGINLVNILIDGGDGVLLEAGGTYLISIGNTGSDEDLWILASDGDDDRGQIRYGPFGQGGAIDWYTGYTNSPVIRANFDPSVGIQENEDVASLSIYPNPTSDNVNINFVSKEDQDVTINVISIDGSLVFAKKLNTKVGQASRTSVDVSNLSSGIYVVQLMGANSSLTQRIVVQ
ncbi:MAG: T9SS type A sorting domain-containing protein [Flavobacteriales bacterium]|nr:T9SS type A sorting domain-containing protein [Flavobacteriales bacterium]